MEDLGRAISDGSCLSNISNTSSYGTYCQAMEEDALLLRLESPTSSHWLSPKTPEGLEGLDMSSFVEEGIEETAGRGHLSKWKPSSFGQDGTLHKRTLVLESDTRNLISPLHDIPLWDIPNLALNSVCLTPRGEWIENHLSMNEPFHPIAIRKRNQKPATLFENCHRWNRSFVPQCLQTTSRGTTVRPEADNFPLIEILDIGFRVRSVGEVYAVKPLGGFVQENGNGGMSYVLLGIDANDSYAESFSGLQSVEDNMPGAMLEIRKWLRGCHNMPHLNTEPRVDPLAKSGDLSDEGPFSDPLSCNEPITAELALTLLAEAHQRWKDESLKKRVEKIALPPAMALGKSMTSMHEYEQFWRCFTKDESEIQVPLRDTVNEKLMEVWEKGVEDSSKSLRRRKSMDSEAAVNRAKPSNDVSSRLHSLGKGSMKDFLVSMSGILQSSKSSTVNPVFSTESPVALSAEGAWNIVQHEKLRDSSNKKSWQPPNTPNTSGPLSDATTISSPPGGSGQSEGQAEFRGLKGSRSFKEARQSPVRTTSSLAWTLSGMRSKEARPSVSSIFGTSRADVSSSGEGDESKSAKRGKGKIGRANSVGRSAGSSVGNSIRGHFRTNSLTDVPLDPAPLRNWMATTGASRASVALSEPVISRETALSLATVAADTDGTEACVLAKEGATAARKGGQLWQVYPFEARGTPVGRSSVIPRTTSDTATTAPGTATTTVAFTARPSPSPQREATRPHLSPMEAFRVDTAHDSFLSPKFMQSPRRVPAALPPVALSPSSSSAVPKESALSPNFASRTLRDALWSPPSPTSGVSESTTSPPFIRVPSNEGKSPSRAAWGSPVYDSEAPGRRQQQQKQQHQFMSSPGRGSSPLKSPLSSSPRLLPRTPLEGASSLPRFPHGSPDRGQTSFLNTPSNPSPNPNLNPNPTLKSAHSLPSPLPPRCDSPSSRNSPRRGTRPHHNETAVNHAYTVPRPLLLRSDSGDAGMSEIGGSAASSPARDNAHGNISPGLPRYRKPHSPKVTITKGLAERIKEAAQLQQEGEKGEKGVGGGASVPGSPQVSKLASPLFRTHSR
eukprot:TRINITY_DN8449_c0_g1_i1.p1 TRINITY_DN8449_c0_g1~~TRINITY_DN8449_c0_g1_i1.p1  ORF type:complete len:1068 (-),score=127.88 TRINITY_DN8449_c0_g1_i1:219-3422(-)